MLYFSNICMIMEYEFVLNSVKHKLFLVSIVKIIKMIIRFFFINILTQKKLLLLNRKNCTRKKKQCFLFWKKKPLQKGVFAKLPWFMYNFYHMNYIYVNSPTLGGCHPQFRHLFHKKKLNDINSIRSKHSHKKRKDILKTLAILLAYLLEVEISEVAIKEILQNIKKWLLSRF